MVTRKKSPPFEVFGGVAFYRWGTLLAWAQSRVSYRGGGDFDQNAA
jgi:hypothetical protein